MKFSKKLVSNLKKKLKSWNKLKKNILIATGGSGGHIIPAIVFYELLKKKFNLSISSDLRGRNFIDYKNYDLTLIETPKIFVNLFMLPINIIMVFVLTIKSICFLKKKKIDLILTTGGYAPVPICLAGIILGKKLYIYEPNFVIGRSNKFFLLYCHKIFCHTKKIKNYPSKYKDKMHIITPIVRKVFYKKNRFNKKKKFTIMVVGGSQGAQVFDECVHKVFQKISKKNDIKIIHQTKLENINYLKKFYKNHKMVSKVFNYDVDFINLIKDCDFCITRAGSSTLAELSLLNIPYLVVPLPTSKDNHQYENAKFFQKENICWILEEKKMEVNKLYNILDNYIKKRKKIITKKNFYINRNNLKIWDYQKKILTKEFNER